MLHEYWTLLALSVSTTTFWNESDHVEDVAICCDSWVDLIAFSILQISFDPGENLFICLISSSLFTFHLGVRFLCIMAHELAKERLIIELIVLLHQGLINTFQQAHVDGVCWSTQKSRQYGHCKSGQNHFNF